MWGWPALPGFVAADSLLTRLDFARDTPAGLERGRRVLEAALRASGIAPESSLFTAHPDRALVAGLALLSGGLCAVWAGLAARSRDRSAPRGPTALALACLVFGLAVLQGTLDPLLPPAPQQNLRAAIEPRAALRHDLLLVAHYDSKTEWLDHRGRGALALAAAVFGAAALMGALRFRCIREVRAPATAARLPAPGWLAVVAVAAGISIALLGGHFIAGRLLPERSHGIVDNGAACALLVEIASEVQASPLEHTRLRFLWPAAEETGAEGSRAACREAALPPPTHVLNLECLGGGPELGVPIIEWSGARLARGDAGMAALLAAATPGRLLRFPLPVVTDAGPWCRAGVPTVTLLGLGPGGVPLSGLHGPGDRLPAIDPLAIQRARVSLHRFLATLDSLP